MQWRPLILMGSAILVAVASAVALAPSVDVWLPWLERVTYALAALLAALTAFWLVAWSRGPSTPRPAATPRPRVAHRPT